jgi:hypothetical protein
MEKKSIVCKKTAPKSKSSRRVDLSKPAPVRVETCRASGDKRVKSLLTAEEFGWRSGGYR